MLICFTTPQTTGDEENRFTGRIGYPLTLEGLDQAREIAADYRSSVNRTFSSPCTGSVQLAELFGEFVILPELADRAAGEYEGRKWNELKKELPPRKYKLWQREWYAKPMFGETYQEIQDRVLKAYKRVLVPCLVKGDTVCVISHPDTLRVLLGHLGGLTEEATIKMTIQNLPYVFRGPF